MSDFKTKADEIADAVVAVAEKLRAAASEECVLGIAHQIVERAIAECRPLDPPQWNGFGINPSTVSIPLNNLDFNTKE